MEKTNFWNDAARGGAVLGAAGIVVNILGMYTTSRLLSLAWITVYILLLFYFMRQRVARYATQEEGYSYGRCLGFIVCMALFAGFLEGVYTWAAMKWLFEAHYSEMLSQSVAMMENSGFYTPEMAEMAMKMVYSPVTMILGGLFVGVLKGTICGLVVAAFTKREPNIFAE